MADVTQASKNMLRRYVSEALTDNCYSPDLAYIAHKYTWVPLFVYGRHKEGFSQHSIIKRWKKIGVGATAARNFEMHRTKEGDAVAFQQGNCGFEHKNTVLARLQGEIYLIPVEYLFDFDAVMENTVFFQRKYRQVVWYSPELSSKKHKPVKISGAFMYIGDWSMWHERSTVLQQCFVPNDKTSPYYSYTKWMDQKAGEA